MDHVKYRVYFAQNAGHFWVEKSLTVAQGSSSIVFSKNSRRYFVRKKVAEIDANSSQSRCPEVQHYSHHSSIPELFWSQRYPDSIVGYPSSATSTITITRFCNRGNLAQLSEMFSFQDNKIPEVVLWRIIHQMFGALVFLHTQARPRVAVDLKPETIFVDLPGSGPAWPDFYVGDLGQSQVLDTQRDHASESLHLTNEEVFHLITRDIESLVRCVLSLITEDTGDTDSFEIALQKVRSNKMYSSRLVSCIEGLLHFAHNVMESDISRYNPNELLNKIANASKVCAKGFPNKIMATWRKEIEIPLVKEFSSEDDLRRHSDLPAGPWQIARVDTRNERILNISQRIYKSESL